MAWAQPTIASVSDAVSPVNGQEAELTITLTSTGTVGIKVKSVEVKQVSGPATMFSNPVQGTTMAGSNLPATYGYSANAGSSATTVFKTKYKALTAGTLIIQVIVHGTRDDDGSDWQAVEASKSITVQ